MMFFIAVVLFSFISLIPANSMAQERERHFDGLRTRENKGMIAVLEAPLFATPDSDAPVIQYVRKGEEIYIHPAEFRKDRYDGLIEEDPATVRAFKDKYQQKYRDPLFDEKGEVYYPEPGSRFYKTMASSGADAYILKDHVFLLYNDLRETTQHTALPDPTDYRIEEPLPPNYPFIQPKGYRGLMSVGLGLPSAPAYSYTSKVNDAGFDFLKEFSFSWLKNAAYDKNRRLFFGAMLNVASSKAEYKMADRRSEEENLRMSAGPFLSYDLWKNSSYRLNLYGSLQLVFLDNLKISQTSYLDSDLSDSREFTDIHFSPRAGMSFQMADLVWILDLVGGVNVSWDLPRTYETQNKSKIDSWWKGDDFDRPSHLQLTYFLGLQRDY